MFFYGLVPIICGGGRSMKYKLSCIAFIHAIFIGWQAFFYLDFRLLLNFSFFSLGLITPFTLVEKLLLKKMLVFGASFFLIIALFALNVYNVYLCSLLIMILVICFSDIFKNLRLNFFETLLSKIAYGGLCAYLFHRFIYGIFRKLLGYFPNVIWAPIMLLSCLLVTYAIQKLYDYMCGKINRKIALGMENDKK